MTSMLNTLGTSHGFPKILSRALRVSETIAACKLEAKLPPEVCNRWYSAGGPEAGITWTDVPREGSDPLPDAHWVCATAARLSLTSSVDARCMHRKEGGTAPCGQRCGKWCEHAAMCPVASARLRAHRQVLCVIAAQLRRAGMETDTERAVPEWFRQGPPGAPEEAILDIVCRSPGTNVLHFLDVTVRAAWAQRYTVGGGAPGRACSTAWREKKARYPDTGGVSVVPIAMETLGRVHEASAEWLRTAANTACVRAGRPQAGRALYRRWRAEQERALVFVEADMCITCLGGESKRFAHRGLAQRDGAVKQGGARLREQTADTDTDARRGADGCDAVLSAGAGLSGLV